MILVDPAGFIRHWFFSFSQIFQQFVKHIWNSSTFIRSHIKGINWLHPCIREHAFFIANATRMVAHVGTDFRALSAILEPAEPGTLRKLEPSTILYQPETKLRSHYLLQSQCSSLEQSAKTFIHSWERPTTSTSYSCFGKKELFAPNQLSTL